MEIIEGKNAIIFKSPLLNSYFLYERLCNTIHEGKLNDLVSLYKKIEKEDYNFQFIPPKTSKKFNQLVLNMTEKCNLRCKYCIYSGIYEGERTYSNLDMDLETSIRALEFYIKNSGKEAFISFYGGEPILNLEKIIKVVEITKKHNKKANFSITTNFTLVNKKTLEFLIENEFSIFISLDGPKKTHDKYRVRKNNDGTYDLIMKNISLLKNMCSKNFFETKVGFNCVFINQNNLRRSYQFFKKNFPNNIVVPSSVQLKLLKSNFLIEKSKKKSEEDILELIKEYTYNIITKNYNHSFLRHLFDYEVLKIYKRDLSVKPKRIVLSSTCVPGYRKLFVSSEGLFYTCEKLERESIGNVKVGLENKSSYNLLEKFIKIKNTLCRQCWASRLCSSCIAHAKDKRSISTKGLKESCYELKSSILTGLIGYTFLIKKDAEKNYKNYFNQIKIK